MEAQLLDTKKTSGTKPARPSHKFNRDKDREMVRGIFRFYEVPGGQLEFCIKLHKEDPVEKFKLVDNQIYTLPLGVAKHLNNNGWYPEYAFNPSTGMSGGHVSDDLRGTSSQSDMRVSKKIRRFGFQSLEFIDVEELNQPNQAVISI